MTTVVCAECGDTFTAERATRRYCSNACRQAHHQARPPKDWRPCEALDCIGDGAGIAPSRRSDARYCCDECRDHDYYEYGGPEIVLEVGLADALRGLGE